MITNSEIIRRAGKGLTLVTAADHKPIGFSRGNSVRAQFAKLDQLITDARVQMPPAEFLLLLTSLRLALRVNTSAAEDSCMTKAMAASLPKGSAR